MAGARRTTLIHIELGGGDAGDHVGEAAAVAVMVAVVGIVLVFAAQYAVAADFADRVPAVELGMAVGVERRAGLFVAAVADTAAGLGLGLDFGRAMVVAGMICRSPSGGVGTIVVVVRLGLCSDRRRRLGGGRHAG